ncbi:helix-turn-helix transcriptional regulator [Gordonia sp. TBRC 11910]|uniref:Helix-turn-helix transcriptional regulator n=1 Tax=Gordonia asplenii TaxID=2725283 RepID=A0A848L415_9ACTN|nr:XRE family transcriptional regulator [Gordonia asplenii]NMO03795.1 helix-turn-helix transcriptional regulator [Gordonia asplenii]
MSDDTSPDVLAHVGANVRRLRSAAGLSQQGLADAAGVSRRTVINLEAGQANVSLAALDTLAAALDTTFVSLVIAPSATRDKIDELMWRGSDSASHATLLGSAPARAEGQLWRWSLGPGDRYDAEPDPDGWHEMLFVTEGAIVVEFDAERVELGVGGHRTYSSAQQYAYVNETSATATFLRVVLE